MLLDVKREIRPPFLVGTVILGFLSIFKKSQTSSPFEALIHVPFEVSRYVSTLPRWGGHLGLSLSSPQGIHTSLHLVQWKMCLHLSHCREIRPSFESGHLSIHSTWGSKLRDPLTYLLWWKGTLEVLVECWTTSSIQTWESTLFSRWYGVHGAYLEFLCWNWCSSIFEMGFSGNLWSRLK